MLIKYSLHMIWPHSPETNKAKLDNVCVGHLKEWFEKSAYSFSCQELGEKITFGQSKASCLPPFPIFMLS